MQLFALGANRHAKTVKNYLKRPISHLTQPVSPATIKVK